MIADLQYIQEVLVVRGELVILVCFDCDLAMEQEQAVLWLEPNSLDFTYLCEECNEKRLKEIELC